MTQENKNLPTIGELFSDNLEVAFKNEQLNLLLNQEPKKEWVKQHPFIKGYNYLPIDKVEFMLRKIFKRYRIEITNQGTAFNGVWVTVRVYYLNPSTNELDWHDGIGACQLQTKGGTSPADLININNGALSMAFPIAKTVAIKDACDHFGKIFGSDLNRKDTVPFNMDATMDSESILQNIKDLFDIKREDMKHEDIEHVNRIISTQETKSYSKVLKILKSL
jgi:hypothetical protein